MAPRVYPADPMMDEMLRRVRVFDAARAPIPAPAADRTMDEALRRVRVGAGR
ncbi:hypothetical protein [Streptomyces sp. NBC_01264]|uniref:hypothetical protein n=1 Tax=Streptomyces sp. NBC_01264 TaxID=2903804 RepID=UPI0022548A1E|nr:hypothetical protein [Streptomyces sp. NBC_01264]MCX4784650.1 hypothetical protein [Streptomyces sp. NBC_01264]